MDHYFHISYNNDVLLIFQLRSFSHKLLNYLLVINSLFALEKDIMPPKITKFIDPSKPKNATKKPTPEKTSLNIDTISKKQPSDYTQKYLEKRKEIESGMKKDQSSRGPRSKKELAN